MLNLNRQEQALTQGQSQGKRVVARAVQIEEVAVQNEEASNSRPGAAAQPAGTGSSAGADAQAVAKRVYEMLRQDLRVEHERRKPGG
jgi:hypothetical protein